MLSSSFRFSVLRLWRSYLWQGQNPFPSTNKLQIFDSNILYKHKYASLCAFAELRSLSFRCLTQEIILWLFFKQKNIIYEQIGYGLPYSSQSVELYIRSNPATVQAPPQDSQVNDARAGPRTTRGLGRATYEARCPRSGIHFGHSFPPARTVGHDSSPCMARGPWQH